MGFITPIVSLATDAVNSTLTESEFVQATWALVGETKILWIATGISGTAIAAITILLGWSQ